MLKEDKYEYEIAKRVEFWFLEQNSNHKLPKNRLRIYEKCSERDINLLII